MHRTLRLGVLAPMIAGYYAISAAACGSAVAVPLSTTPGYYDGARFHNQVPVQERGFFSFLKWRLSSDAKPWQEVSDAAPGPPPPLRVGRGELRVTFVNHATVLVQLDGLNILTDPMYSERDSPLSWIGPKRFRPPGIRFEDLPPIDVVLVSHNHYDHMDLPTLARLAETHRPDIIVGLGNAAFLADEGIPGAVDLGWGQSVSVSDEAQVTGVPAQHWSGRGLFDQGKTLWLGFVIEGPGGPVYFAGDTGWGPHFEQIAERFGPMRLAILPIGHYQPRWFMKDVHMSPEEAADAAVVLRAETSVAMHFGTFRLADDGQDEPPAALESHLAVMSEPKPRFWVLGFGEGRDVPQQKVETTMTQTKKPNQEELRKRLSCDQFHVTQEQGTERPFENAYWNNKAPGIYVDIVSGEPLFSSLDKFDSGTGWPSFTRPLEGANIVRREDDTLGMKRVEVRSRGGDSHLGHVFDDGPAPTGLRYCINSAAMRFVPAERLRAEGHEKYAALFEKPEAKRKTREREEAVLAGGCFWGVQEIVRKIPGVIETKVGYTGGNPAGPHYEDVKTGRTGHAEAVKVVFDPRKLSYEDLLDYFFRLHDPTTVNRQGNDVGTQYRSAIFYFDEDQRQVAEKVKERVDKSGKWKGRVVTEIVAAGEFYPAEEYHQDYLVKHPDGYTCHYLRD